MNDKLKQLYDALLDRGLSLLPPKADPMSAEVTEEAVMIYEALVASPLPKDYPLPPPPRTTDVPVHSLGIVYPKVANTPGHDTAVVPAGTLLLPGLAGSTSRAKKTSVQTIATTVAQTGVALLCKTVDGSPWPSEVTVWSFESPPPGCFIAASAVYP